MKTGFNLVERRAIIDKTSICFEDRMSVIEFLKQVKFQGAIPQDVAVFGLEYLLIQTEDRMKLSKYIRNLLIESANFLMRRRICVEFVLDGSLEAWQHPIINLNDQNLDLYAIFGSMERVDINHFFKQLNILS